jgi:hypothetical protein
LFLIKADGIHREPGFSRHLPDLDSLRQFRSKPSKPFLAKDTLWS